MEVIIVEKMLQIPVRINILDSVEKYIERFNKSGMTMYKLKKPQMVSEALMECMANHPIEKKEKVHE